MTVAKYIFNARITSPRKISNLYMILPEDVRIMVMLG